MSFSVQEAKSELEGMLHGTTLGQVQNINGVFNRAARQLLLDIDPAETKIIANMPLPIFPILYDYPTPPDLKGNKIIDIFPQIGREPGQRMGQTYNQIFDLNKALIKPGEFTILNNKGVKTLRISYFNNTSGALINAVSSLADNGTWVLSGTGSFLTQDLSTNINGQHCLGFIMSTGTATLTNSDMTPIDLSAYENVAAILFKLYISDASKFTSYSFKYGSDASNYYDSGLSNNTPTGTFLNTWNDAGTLWIGTTKVGNPDLTNIKYLEINVTATDAELVKVAQVWASIGVDVNVEYYSKYLFSDVTTGVWQEKVTDDSNLINLDTESYNLYLYQAAFLCVQQALGQDAGYDTNVFLDKYNQALIRYKRMYKSEISKPQQMYYKRTFKGYNEQLGTTLSHSQ